MGQEQDTLKVSKWKPRKFRSSRKTPGCSAPTCRLLFYNITISSEAQEEIGTKIDLCQDNHCMIWAIPAICDVLPPGEVHLWRVHLLQPAPVVQRCRDLLAPDELNRADRFYFDKDRNRFIIARAMLKTVLGNYLKIQPRQVQFIYGPQEKPDLRAEINPRCFKFNLS